MWFKILHLVLFDDGQFNDLAQMCMNPSTKEHNYKHHLSL